MTNWEPRAPIENLKLRAELLRRTRLFFAEREVLEVETPLLSRHAVTAPHIDCPAVKVMGTTRYLQSSPEYAMKRLIAAGAGSIYQICKAFRDGELGRQHNPEFTLVEWYRLGFELEELMDEVEELLSRLLGTGTCKRRRFQEVFEERLSIDPFRATTEELASLAERERAVPEGGLDRRVDWLEWLMATLVQPGLGTESPVFVFDYPVEMAQLSRLGEASSASPVSAEAIPFASRFELYIDGLELANGFHELIDPDEQERRFQTDRAVRSALGKPDVEIDPRLIQALHSGMPECSGVALGFDRLLMIRAAASDIGDVLAFDWARG